jgi:hypothetical protein
MSVKEKARGFAEWLEHGKAVVEVLAALGAGTVVKAMLNEYSRIPSVWITPIWLLSSAVILGVLMRYFKPRRELAQSVAQTGLSVPMVQPPPVNFNAADYFRLSYKSEMTSEVEKNIKIIANQNQPNDREGFLAYFIGVGLVAYLHDLTWAYIFRSQILMLTAMTRNNGWLRLSEAKSYYDNAAMQSPDTYRNYSYDQWLQFLMSQQLIIRHPSEMLEITIRGKDFLKYLTHWGRLADDRKN